MKLINFYPWKWKLSCGGSTHNKQLDTFFLEFEPMMSAPDDSYVLSDQDTN